MLGTCTNSTYTLKVKILQFWKINLKTKNALLKNVKFIICISGNVTIIAIYYLKTQNYYFVAQFKDCLERGAIV